MFAYFILLSVAVATSIAKECPSHCQCVCPSTTQKPVVKTTPRPTPTKIGGNPPDCPGASRFAERAEIYRKVLEMNPKLKWSCELEDDARQLRSRYYIIEHPLEDEVRMTGKRSSYKKAVDFVGKAKWEKIIKKIQESKYFGCYMNVKSWSNWDFVEIICRFTKEDPNSNF